MLSSMTNEAHGQPKLPFGLSQHKGVPWAGWGGRGVSREDVLLTPVGS